MKLFACACAFLISAFMAVGAQFKISDLAATNTTGGPAVFMELDQGGVKSWKISVDDLAKAIGTNATVTLISVQTNIVVNQYVTQNSYISTNYTTNLYVTQVAYISTNYVTNLYVTEVSYISTNYITNLYVTQVAYISTNYVTNLYVTQNAYISTNYTTNLLVGTTDPM